MSFWLLEMQTIKNEDDGRYCSQVPCERNCICPFKIACGDGAYALTHVTVLAHG